MKAAYDTQTFCIYPWVHIYGGPAGDWRLCCYQDGAGKPPVANAREYSLAAIWNSAVMRDLRHKLLQGERLSLCASCYQLEEVGIKSPRMLANKDWKEHLYKAGLTHSDGSTDSPVVFLDIRFSNECNFRCRMCWHLSSSAWYADAKKLGRTAGPRIIDYWTSNEVFWKDFAERVIPQIEALYFGGGEPLVQSAHYQMLDLLVGQGRTDVRLVYTSNLSILPEHLITETWKKFDSVFLLASIDGLGETGSYIRKGLDWDRWFENVRRAERYIRRFCVALTIYNAFHFPVLYSYLRNHFPEVPIQTELVTEPEFLSLRILDGATKEVVHATYEQFLEAAGDEDPEIRDQVRGWMDYMDQPDERGIAVKFKDFTQRLDAIRNESFIRICPELEAWYRNIPSAAG